MLDYSSPLTRPESQKKKTLSLYCYRGSSLSNTSIRIIPIDNNGKSSEHCVAILKTMKCVNLKRYENVFNKILKSPFKPFLVLRLLPITKAKKSLFLLFDKVYVSHFM